jgi:DNA-binding HxlR family transcriptional regulator
LERLDYLAGHELGHESGQEQQELRQELGQELPDGLIERTISESPNHPAQKFRLTQRGKMFLELLNHK